MESGQGGLMETAREERLCPRDCQGGKTPSGRLLGRRDTVRETAGEERLCVEDCQGEETLSGRLLGSGDCLKESIMEERLFLEGRGHYVGDLLFRPQKEPQV